MGQEFELFWKYLDIDIVSLTQSLNFKAGVQFVQAFPKTYKINFVENSMNEIGRWFTLFKNFLEFRCFRENVYRDDRTKIATVVFNDFFI